jgi:Flp pilus assembly protein TadB
MSEPRPAIQKLRRQKERHRQRSRIYRIVFAVFAVLVVLAGIVLSLPFVPGPGLLLIAIGLGMLALEFERAERLLERILDRVEAAREHASPLQQTLIAIGGVLLLGAYLTAVLLTDIPLLPG